jgi:hypothetical protein
MTIHCVHIGAMVGEEFNSAFMSGAGGKNQRGLAIKVGCVRVGAHRNTFLHLGQIARVTGKDQLLIRCLRVEPIDVSRQIDASVRRH